MRVLYVSHYNGLGGAERSLLDLMCTVRNFGIVPFLAAPESGALADAARRHGIQNFPIWAGRVQRPASALAAADLSVRILSDSVRLARIAIVKRIDILHANSAIAQLAAGPGAFLCGRYNVWHWRDFYRPGLLQMSLGRFADIVITISPAIHQEAASQLKNNSKLRLVANGLQDLPRSDPEAVLAWRRRANANPNDLLVVALGQSVPRKGFRVLIDAISMLSERALGVRVLIVCNELDALAKRHTETLRHYISKLQIAESVTIVAGCSDPAALLRAADVVAVPSLCEPFGRVAVEAMLAERPVVVSAVDGLLDIVEHNVNGFHFPVGDAESLARVLIHLAEHPDLRGPMGQSGRRRALQDFSSHTCAMCIARIYRELVAKAA